MLIHFLFGLGGGGEFLRTAALGPSTPFRQDRQGEVI